MVFYPIFGAVFMDLLTPEALPSPRRGRKIIFAILTVVFIVLFFAFAWRVYGFYRRIQLGLIDTSSFSFQKTYASSQYLSSLAAAAPGSGSLDTTDDPSLGAKSAKLTIVYFADFGCPYSEEVSHVVRAVAAQHPDDVRFVYRDFPLTELHPGADLAAVAGACADQQGKFWEMHDVLYDNSGDFTADTLTAMADQVGLNTAKFQTCLQDPQVAAEVAGDLADGVAAGVVGTPTFFFNGQKIEGSIPFSTFNDLIHAFLQT